MSAARATGPRRAIDGVLLLDKPPGITSQTAVSRAKRLLGAAKAGHTGTLDPMATGLLPVAFGEATKFSQSLLDADKTYIAQIRLGVTTTTGDLDGEVLERAPVVIDRLPLEDVLSRFCGEIEQTPPMYSALKKAGKPLYEYARAGIVVEREARRITIRSLRWVDRVGDDPVLEVHCSKGTYVRVLAEDIGKALGCGACLAGLRRTRVGPLDISDAITLDQLADVAPAGEEAGRAGGTDPHAVEEARARHLRPVDALVLELPDVALDHDQALRIMNGQSVECADGLSSGLFRIYGPGAAFLGVAQAISAGRLEPRRLIAARPRIG